MGSIARSLFGIGCVDASGSSTAGRSPANTHKSALVLAGLCDIPFSIGIVGLFPSQDGNRRLSHSVDDDDGLDGPVVSRPIAIGDDFGCGIGSVVADRATWPNSWLVAILSVRSKTRLVRPLAGLRDIDSFDSHVRRDGQ